MKAVAVLVAIFALALLMIPMIALNFEATPASGVQVAVHSPLSDEPAVPNAMEKSPQQETVTAEPNSAKSETAPATGAVEGVDIFRILDVGTGKVTEVSVRDYVRGAVAVEMPASFHTEALKAQAVAAHTYALAQHAAQQASPDPDLQGADFTADPVNRIGYITRQQALDFYGEEQAEMYWDKVCGAVDSVLDQVLVYEEEPIVAAYHAISAGRTEDAGNVWSGSAPYLKPVESQGDYLAPDYNTQVSYTGDEVRQRILAVFPQADLSGEPDTWFGETLYSDSGYVLYVKVGGVEIQGKQLRQIFDLRSHNFEVSTDDGTFTFQVCGYGHGVGLSQYGADYLARQGSTYDEILETYYTGAQLVSTS